MKIDLNTKKTEADWQRAIDDFWIKATPRWFEWLGWLLILGAFSFLTELTQNVILSIAHSLSYIALFFYLQSFFFSLDFHGLPFVKSEKIRKLISLLVSGILSYGIWLFLSRLVLETSGKILNERFKKSCTAHNSVFAVRCAHSNAFGTSQTRKPLGTFF